MRIRGNMLSLLSWRALHTADHRLEQSQQRLASGLRVSTASDDAAGMFMSQNMMGQIKGLVRASRNALDGHSLLGTAEGALNEISTLLQRGRELAIQAANGTLTTGDRQMLQTEMDQILLEVDRISDTTVFNGRRLLNKNGNSAAISATLQGLRSGWLEKAREVINTYYGLTGDGSSIDVVLEYGGLAPTWLTGTPGANGVLDDLAVHINLADFGSAGGPDGGTGPMYNDRKVARILTQALLARNSSYTGLPEWFISGVSDFIAGGDEELAENIATHGQAGVISAISSWADDSLHRSAAYLAVKYLNDQLTMNGFTMADLMDQLKGPAYNTLDAALANLGMIDEGTFLLDFQFFGGPGYLSGLVSGGALSDADVGGIHPGDASAVIPNGGTYSLDPLLPEFSVAWQNSALMDPVKITLQVGANEGETLELEIPNVSTLSLNLIGMDLVAKPDLAMERFRVAIDTVASVRGHLGTATNRLTATVGVNDLQSENQVSNYSRIVDLDYARELSNQTRDQIILLSASAMMAQANTVRQHVLWLLKDLSVPNLARAMPSSI